MQSGKMIPAVLLAVCVPAFASAGTVTVDRVFADGIYVREIGMRPPRTGEALYYPFASDGGGTAADASGNGHGGTVSGCVWTDSGPFAGGCMFFDGSDDYIDVGAAPDFPAWDQYSVSVWFLHNGGGDWDSGYGHKILDKTAYCHDWYISLYPYANGCIAFGMYEGGGAGFGMGGGNTNYMDNAWHHVVVVRDGINGQFWVDGAQTGASTNMISVYSSSDVCVGNSFSDDYYQRKCWSGLLDEVRVFDRALGSNEVARLYAEGALLATNAAPSAVSVTTNLTVCGGLTVTGRVSFASGVAYARPLGDLSCGIYTNAP
jgi:hypothetical protein